MAIDMERQIDGNGTSFVKISWNVLDYENDQTKNDTIRSESSHK